jgi:hypothetical protein
LPDRPSGGLASKGDPSGGPGISMDGFACRRRAGIFDGGGAAGANDLGVRERRRRLLLDALAEGGEALG